MKNSSLSPVAYEIGEQRPPFAGGVHTTQPHSALLPLFAQRLVIIKCFVLEVSYPQSLPVEEELISAFAEQGRAPPPTA